MSTTTNRERIAAQVSELTAESVRQSGNGNLLINCRYCADTDSVGLRVALAQPNQRNNEQQHHVLFDEQLNLLGYSNDPKATLAAEQEALITLDNWLDYLYQLEQQRIA